jgi:hypothetical protein
MTIYLNKIAPYYDRECKDWLHAEFMKASWYEDRKNTLVEEWYLYIPPGPFWEHSFMCTGIFQYFDPITDSVAVGKPAFMNFEMS